MLAMLVDYRTSPVDMIAGRVDCTAVGTSSVPIANLRFVTVVPEPSSGNVPEDFGFWFAKLRQKAVDNELINVTNASMIGAHTIELGSAGSS